MSIIQLQSKQQPTATTTTLPLIILLATLVVLQFYSSSCKKCLYNVDCKACGNTKVSSCIEGIPSPFFSPCSLIVCFLRKVKSYLLLVSLGLLSSSSFLLITCNKALNTIADDSCDIHLFTLSPPHQHYNYGLPTPLPIHDTLFLNLLFSFRV